MEGLAVRQQPWEGDERGSAPEFISHGDKTERGWGVRALGIGPRRRVPFWRTPIDIMHLVACAGEGGVTSQLQAVNRPPPRRWITFDFSNISLVK